MVFGPSLSVPIRFPLNLLNGPISLLRIRKQRLDDAYQLLGREVYQGASIVQVGDVDQVGR